MEKELNTNNSKKIIIGVSILFCTVILIIGGTIAFFTQSGSETTGNIVTTDINDTLEYSDDKNYMRQALIPAKEEIAKQAYALEDTNKCIDKNGYTACSVYQFTIKNKANVSQELIIDMIPTGNSFGNLYFMLYEIDKNGNSNELISSQKIEKVIDINKIPTYNLKNNLTLNPEDYKTYEVVFFINETGEDQTLEDGGKQYGASIKVSSISTGKYLVESFGEECWKTELLEDGTYKLTEFYGVDNNETITDDEGNSVENPNYGSVLEVCENVYVTKDETTGFYSVNIPSNVGGKQISTLGNSLFSAMFMKQGGDAPIIYSNYSKINNITIQEGITTIEDGGSDIEDGDLTGTFMYKGMDLNSGNILENYNFNIQLPNSLTYIGNASFVATLMNEIVLPPNLKTIGDTALSQTFLTNITIPKSVETIGRNAFSGLKRVTFEGALDGTSQLKTIGNSAFYSCDLTYETEIDPLIIPTNIESIGEWAFSYSSNPYNQNLKYILYLGNNEEILSNNPNSSDWYTSDIAKLLKELPNEG